MNKMFLPIFLVFLMNFVAFAEQKSLQTNEACEVTDLNVKHHDHDKDKASLDENADASQGSKKSLDQRKKNKTKSKIDIESLALGGVALCGMALIVTGTLALRDSVSHPSNTCQSNDQVRLDRIFEYATGLEERADMPLNFEQDDNGLSYIFNRKTLQPLCCGAIVQSTLVRLRQQYAAAQAAGIQKLGNPSFHILCYFSGNADTFDRVDIGALQADPANKDAVFQLASRMHCLEGGCAHNGVNANANFGFTNGMSRPTQGELGCFSAAPGTFYKMYGHPPMNLLLNTPYERLINPNASGGGMPTVDQLVVAATPDVPANWTDNLQIYFHRDIDVVVGGRIRPCESKNDKLSEVRKIWQAPINRINQIPVAAFDWRLFNPTRLMAKDDPRKVFLKKITKPMLEGFYEGTLLAAALNGKRKIYLTAVGGGAFGNDLDLVAGAISNEINLKIICDYGLEVILVIHEIGKLDNVALWRNSMDSFWQSKVGIKYDGFGII
ncbi:MAG: hypothetical protein US49_C0001G0003 [candidate division TM6 bacterium GW2011_GWF2_37_49]|nr:MAG: hypothetical protein US49_C0001G0003 [candidate division TM6 bacterium GW2011_GWF2_37_49]